MNYKNVEKYKTAFRPFTPLRYSCGLECTNHFQHETKKVKSKQIKISKAFVLTACFNRFNLTYLGSILTAKAYSLVFTELYLIQLIVLYLIAM